MMQMIVGLILVAIGLPLMVVGYVIFMDAWKVAGG